MTNDAVTIPAFSRPRGDCPHCDEKDALLYEDEDFVGCAQCYRVRARRFDRVQSCDDCGEPGAFRDPSHRRDEYFCSRCHAKRGYIPTERSMISRVMVRASDTHSQGRKAVCIAAGYGTDCSGQIKPRGKLGVLCDFHARGGRA